MIKIDRLLTNLGFKKERDFPESHRENIDFLIFKGKLTKYLLFCVVVFFFGHLLEGFVGSDNPIKFMNLNFWTGVDTERNIPTLFSVFLLMSASVLLAAIASLREYYRKLASAIGLLSRSSFSSSQLTKHCHSTSAYVV